MPEFLELLPPGNALDLLLEHLHPVLEPEEIDVTHAAGRVTVTPIHAPYPLPPFSRSTVDGYACRAADTFGASESLPSFLRVIQEVPMGSAPGFALGKAECALIHTGGMLPEGADAVVMLEHTQSVKTDEIEVLRAVAYSENILEVGEDVSEGELVIASGTRLRPAEIGGLAALGITRIKVARKPSVGIIASGDEVVPPQVTALPGQVKDVNTYSLSALVEQEGGIPVPYGIAPDQEQALHEVASRALAQCDMVVITAGSSASSRDLTAQVINRLGPPGVLVHGVNVRPGKPTILAVCAGVYSEQPKAVIGLPGNPVSALVIASLFVVPVLKSLLGESGSWLRISRPARIAINLASQAGREDWIPVKLVSVEDDYQAQPIFGKSNLIFNLAKADGMVRIPPDATGLAAGEWVEVHLLW